MHIGADSDTTGYTTGSPPTTCVIETTLDKVSRWIGSGPRTTLAGDANADIMKTIIECVRERVIRGARTFMIKVKTH
jgi:hypothetical protein